MPSYMVMQGMLKSIVPTKIAKRQALSSGHRQQRKAILKAALPPTIATDKPTIKPSKGNTEQNASKTTASSNQ
jgi:hypothetical protein